MTFKIWAKVTIYNIHNDALRWQIHDFLSDGSSNVYCLTISEIFTNPEKCQNFDLWRSRRTGLASFDWKCPILYWWFFQNISYRQRETGILTIGKIRFPWNHQTVRASHDSKLKRKNQLISPKAVVTTEERWKRSAATKSLHKTKWTFRGRITLDISWFRNNFPSLVI